MNSFKRSYPSAAHPSLFSLLTLSALAGCSVYDPALLRSPADASMTGDLGVVLPDMPTSEVQVIDVPNPTTVDAGDVPTVVDVPNVDVPGVPCGAGETRCGADCVDLQSNLQHCGQCNVGCPSVTNGTAQCTAGTCRPSCTAPFSPYDSRTCVPPLTEPCPAAGTGPAIIQPNIAHVRTGSLTGRRADLTFSTASCTPASVLGTDEVYAMSASVAATFRADLYTEGFDAAVGARTTSCAAPNGNDQCLNALARAGRETLTTPSITAGSTTFFVAKATGGVTGPYALVVTPTSACGNRVLDVTEECDDGNVDDNDGCSGACRVTATVGDACDAVLPQAISAAYGTELYRINLVGARDNFALACNPMRSPETIVYVRARNSGRLRVQSRDGIVGIFSGVCAMGAMPSACGTMLAPAEVLSVTAGSLYALVLEPRVLGARQVDLTIDLAQCNNGTIETSYGEECDDGNLTNGDGCSSTCRREPACSVTWPGAIAATYADPARPPFTRCANVPFGGVIVGNNPMATTSSVTLVPLMQGDIVTATIARSVGNSGLFGVEILTNPMTGSTTTACSTGGGALNCAFSMSGVNGVTWASPMGGSYYVRFFSNTVMGSDYMGSIVVTRAPRP